MTKNKSLSLVRTISYVLSIEGIIVLSVPYSLLKIQIGFRTVYQLYEKGNIKWYIPLTMRDKTVKTSQDGFWFSFKYYFQKMVFSILTSTKALSRSHNLYFKTEPAQSVSSQLLFLNSDPGRHKETLGNQLLFHTTIPISRKLNLSALDSYSPSSRVARDVPLAPWLSRRTFLQISVNTVV